MTQATIPQATAPGADTAKPRAPSRARLRGRADGEASRARLLEAAGKLFAEQGYASVSTRALAKAGKANLSAIGYHFGGKEGLYREVLRQLLADTEPMLHPAIERLDAGVAAAGGDRVRLARLMTGFLHGLIGAILGNERMRWQVQLMLREFHQPSKFFPMLLEERIHPLHNAVARLIGAATGRDPEAAETRLLTAAVIGQCMVMGAGRRVVCARLGWDDYTPERVAFIARTITPAVLSMFGLPAVEGGPEQGAK